MVTFSFELAARTSCREQGYFNGKRQLLLAFISQ